MITFKEYLSEVASMYAKVAAQQAANTKKFETQMAARFNGTSSYQQGKKDKAAGKEYNNPHPFDAKAGADVNYDHNQYHAGYHA